MENSPRNESQENAAFIQTQASEQSEKDFFDFDSIEVKEVNFELHTKKVAKQLFAEALRELGYYGAFHDLAGAHIRLRDKSNHNVIEIGFNVDNGEYLLRLVTSRQPQPTRTISDSLL